ncbi:MAG: aquaporin [Chloroflexota bacterium]
MNDLVKPVLAEFIGTFTLVFIGAGAVAATVQNGFDVTVPAFAHGLVVLALIYAYGHISGTHLNPAVTVGLLVGGHIDVTKAIAYIIAQFIAGIVAAYVLFAMVDGPAGNYGQTVGSITDTNLIGAVVFEAILTFFLVSSIYQSAVFGKAGNFAGVAIGLTLVFCILAGGPYTGASLNPARTLGPALAAGQLGYVFPYFIGLFAGGALAGVVQQYLLGPDSE